MTRIRKLFLLLTLIGPLHMGEQLLTGLEEFDAIRALVARYYGLFDPSAGDHATVLLITIVWTVVSVMLYALLLGGTPRLLVAGFFGAFGVTEVHHLIEAVVKRAYDPGVVTCVPYAVVGGLLVVAVAQELGGRQPIAAAQGGVA